MKALFVLLVVINLLVFGVEYQRQHRPAKAQMHPESVLPAGVQRLRLVGELNRGVGEGAAGLATETGGETDNHALDVLADQALSELLGGGGGEAQVIEPAPSLPMETPPVPGSSPLPETELAVAKLAEPAPGSSPAEAATQSIDPDAVSASGVVAGAETAAEPPTAEQEPVERCFTLGPVKKQTEAKILKDRLESMATGVELRKEIREMQIGYWVLIPSLGSRGQARAKVRELKQAGIEDVWRFTKGRLANAISLGLFSRRAPAERRRREINRKGFATQVQPRYTEQTLYWLDFLSTEDPERLPEFKEMLAREHAGVTWSVRECAAAPP